MVFQTPKGLDTCECQLTKEIKTNAVYHYVMATLS